MDFCCRGEGGGGGLGGEADDFAAPAHSQCAPFGDVRVGFLKGGDEGVHCFYILGRGGGPGEELA